MSLPLVSVIIVTWNRKDDVLETVGSVYCQDYTNVEVVVVDNGSTDNTVGAVHAAYPAITTIALERNLGASAGRNPGIVAARGEIIFLLDSDASLAQDTLTRIVGKFQEAPEVGVIACKIVNATTKQIDRHAGWVFSEKDRADQDCEFFSYSFSEGGCAFRAEVFRQAGPFSDLLFFGREGEELSLRVWDAGYQIVYYPQALVFHRVSPQQQIPRSDRDYFDLRNSLYLYVLRYPWWMLAAMTPLRVGVSLVRAIKRGQTRETLTALRDVGRSLPPLWKQRLPIRNETALHYLQLQREHGPLRWDLVSWLRYKT